MDCVRGECVARKRQGCLLKKGVICPSFSPLLSSKCAWRLLCRSPFFRSSSCRKPGPSRSRTFRSNPCGQCIRSCRQNSLETRMEKRRADDIGSRRRRHAKLYCEGSRIAAPRRHLHRPHRWKLFPVRCVTAPRQSASAASKQRERFLSFQSCHAPAAGLSLYGRPEVYNALFFETEQSPNALPRLDVRDKREPVDRWLLPPGHAINRWSTRHHLFDDMALMRAVPFAEDVGPFEQKERRRRQGVRSPVACPSDNVPIGGDAADHATGVLGVEAAKEIFPGNRTHADFICAVADADRLGLWTIPVQFVEKAMHVGRMGVDHPAAHVVAAVM